MIIKCLQRLKSWSSNVCKVKKNWSSTAYKKSKLWSSNAWKYKNVDRQASRVKIKRRSLLSWGFTDQAYHDCQTRQGDDCSSSNGKFDVTRPMWWNFLQKSLNAIVLCKEGEDNPAKNPILEDKEDVDNSIEHLHHLLVCLFVCLLQESADCHGVCTFNHCPSVLDNHTWARVKSWYVSNGNIDIGLLTFIKCQFLDPSPPCLLFCQQLSAFAFAASVFTPFSTMTLWILTKNEKKILFTILPFVRAANRWIYFLFKKLLP